MRLIRDLRENEVKKEQADGDDGEECPGDDALAVAAAKGIAFFEKERPEPDPRGQTGKAEDSVSVAAGEAEYRAPRASEEHQCAHGGYHAEDKTDDGCGTPARFEFPRGDGGGQRAEHQPHDFRAQVLDDGRAVQAKPSGHIALEARYADPPVCRVAELLQPYGDQADDGAHNDDARRCRKKIFPHLLLRPNRCGGYTMRTMAPS